MFTGIIEQTGVVIDIINHQSNKHIFIKSSLLPEIKVDQSIAHNGICLTVVEKLNDSYKVTAIEETINRTNLKNIKINDQINLERCMLANGRFDGHIVQGHVDDIAFCKSVENKNGSWLFTFKINDESNKNLLVKKGSVCINGISLTLASVSEDEFNVAIIPYTFENTNMKQINERSIVNIEYDIIGKYISKILNK